MLIKCTKRQTLNERALTVCRDSSTNGKLRGQRFKILKFQLLVAVPIAVVYGFIQPSAMSPLVYSLMTGVLYAGLLGVPASLSLKMADPRKAMMLLYIGAIIRFGIMLFLFAQGLRFWNGHAMAVLLPALIMLVAPIFLLRGSKRLTD